MNTTTMQLGELPEEFLTLVKSHFVPYTVALARVHRQQASSFTTLGTGTLIQKEDKIGILTAYHCTHACTPRLSIGPGGGDNLLLCVGRGRLIELPPEILFETYTTQRTSDEYGPDLTFIEIFPSSQLETIRTNSLIWNMDKLTADQILTDFGSTETMLAAIGYPESQCKTDIQENNIHRKLHHMTYINVINDGDISEKDGWDYLRSKYDYSESTGELPPTFQGLSGGAIWAMQCCKNRDSNQISIKKYCLVGVSFYETSKENNIRYLRGHFIRSIYEKLWEC